MKHIENIIVGHLEVDPQELFAFDKTDWLEFEEPMTLYTEERYLPKILVACGAVSSANEVRRNKPNLCIDLGNKPNFLEVKWGKRKFWIAVGK